MPWHEAGDSRLAEKCSDCLAMTHPFEQISRTDASSIGGIARVGTRNHLNSVFCLSVRIYAFSRFCLMLTSCCRFVVIWQEPPSRFDLLSPALDVHLVSNLELLHLSNVSICDSLHFVSLQVSGYSLGYFQSQLADSSPRRVPRS